MVRRRSLLFSASGRRKMHDGGHHGRDGDGRTRRPRLGRWQLENTGRFLWRLHGGDWGRRGGGRNCGERQMKEKKRKIQPSEGDFYSSSCKKLRAGRIYGICSSGFSAGTGSYFAGRADIVARCSYAGEGCPTVRRPLPRRRRRGIGDRTSIVAISPSLYSLIICCHDDAAAANHPGLPVSGELAETRVRRAPGGMLPRHGPYPGPRPFSKVAASICHQLRVPGCQFVCYRLVIWHSDVRNNVSSIDFRYKENVTLNEQAAYGVNFRRIQIQPLQTN